MKLATERAAAHMGDFLRDHATLLRSVQWGIVVFYVFLLIVPIFKPLPDNAASIMNNLTLLAQFIFWGIWWPFVLLSMLFVGRAWCGLFCPEGTLTEWASAHGQNHKIPRWMRWGGWPFVTFVLMTIYGQLVSVYQYPFAVLAVLGGSTVVAMIVGWRYGRHKRVWCKYLCPVNGVFQVLAKLSPWHFKVNEVAWRHAVIPIKSVNCAPLLPLRHMKGAGDCHMCGRCSGYRGAITLTPRSPEAEIVQLNAGDAWQTALIVFGLMGIAVGAFLWSTSPWFVIVKQAMATWLIEHDIIWPLLDNAPWFILTHYPSVNDSFSWLDGACIVLFIVVTTLVVSGVLYLALWRANRVLSISGKHKLAQALIPLAGTGVFLGLSATTINLLKHEGMSTNWVNPVRFTLLTLALGWSVRLAWRLMRPHTTAWTQRLIATGILLIGLLPFCSAWVLFFVVW